MIEMCNNDSEVRYYFFSAIENRQCQRIGCIEEIAWQMDFISLEQLGELGNLMKSSDYGKYILSLVES